MTREESLKIVQGIYGAFGRGDVPALLSYLDDNIEWEMVGPPHAPITGKRSGKSGALEFFMAVAQSADMKAFEPREFIADEDKVVVWGFESLVVKSTGKAFQSDWAHLWCLKGGKVTKFQGFNDGYAFGVAVSK